MGCCSDRVHTELKASDDKTAKEADLKTKKSEASGGLQKPNSLVLHLQSKNQPHRVLKVLQVLATVGNVGIEIQETANLETINPKIVRYPTAVFQGQALVGEVVINRYVAQKVGWYPQTPEDVYDCESLVDQILDMWVVLEKSADPDTLYTQAQLLDPIEKRLKKGKYFVGSKATYVDVYVFAFLQEFYLSDQLIAQRGNAVPKKLQDYVLSLKDTAPFKAALKAPSKK